MARLPSYIARVDTGDGVRYEVRLHARRADGSRFRHKKRFKTPAEATAWHSTITADLASGTRAAPSNVTVREAVDQWLAAKSARVKPDEVNSPGCVGLQSIWMRRRRRSPFGGRGWPLRR